MTLPCLARVVKHIFGVIQKSFPYPHYTVGFYIRGTPFGLFSAETGAFKGITFELTVAFIQATVRG